MPDTFTFEEASQPDTFSFEEASGASKQSDLRAQMASLRAEPRAGGVAESVTPFVESVANMPANIMNVARYPLSKVGLAPEEPYQAGKSMVPALAKAPRWMFGVPGIVADLAPGTVVGDVGTAISDVSRNFASGTTTPENMLALGAGATTSPLAQRAISSTFAGTMGGEVPAQVLETASTLQDPESTRLEKLKSVAGTVGTAAGAVAAGLHAVRGEAISEAADKARAAGLARAAEAAEKTAAEPAAQPEVTPDASKVASPEGVPQPEVRAQVGQETPLRQQGEPAVAGAPEAQAPEVAPAPISTEAEAQSAGKGGGATTAEPAAKPAAPAASEPEAAPAGAKTEGKADQLRADIQTAQDSIKGLQQDWLDIKEGKVPTGKFTRYASKAAAKRAIDKEIANWKRDLDKWKQQLSKSTPAPSPVAPAEKPVETKGSDVRFTEGVPAKTPQSPEEWIEWYRGALATDELARETQSTYAPKLTEKQRREYKRDLAKLEEQVAAKPAETKAETERGLGVPPVVSEMLSQAQKAAHELTQKISNVKTAPYVEGQKFESITFELNGKQYRAELKGRNKDLVVGVHPEADKGIASRAFLDGDAVEIKSITSPQNAETAKPTTLPTESVASDWTSATAEPTELHAGLPVPKALQFANRKMSQLDEATTLHSGKVQKSFDEARRAQREINKAVPTERRQAAISVWREAGGDIPTLQSWAAAAKGKMFKQAAIDAQTLTPEEIAIANKAIAAFQVLETRGNRFDVLNSHRDNYVPHVWDVKPPGQGMGFGIGMLKQRFKFSKARTFNNFFEGDQAGFIPKTLAIGKLLPAYIHEMNRVIADRQLVADIVNRKGSDGRDLAVPTGNVTTVDDSGGKAVLVKPQVSRVPDTTDYRQIPNQPALSKWTWEGKDTEGNPVFVKADLALHPDAYRRINAIIGQSALRSWYHDPAPGFAQVPRAVARGLDYAQSAMKREMFGLLAPFHQVQEGTHAIGHVVNPFFNIPKIDMRRPDMMDAANHGLMLLPDRSSARTYLEGVGTQSSLTSRAIRKAGPVGRAISDVIDGYQDYLFHQYIPGLKFKTYEALLKRNLKLYADELKAGTMTPADVKITSAEQANAAYGHLNYALLDRNPTIQHIIQLASLAPDFLEARTRFSGQAVKGLTSKVGHEQFKAIAILAAAQAGAAFVLSNLLGGTYDSKHPFELVYKGRRYSMRSVPEDIYNLLKDTHQFIYSRVNPLTVKGPIQFLTGMNYRGEKVSATDTFEELLAGYIPITARAIPAIRSLTETGRQNPVSPLQQLAGSLGLRISRYSPISETYKRAGDWMDSQKIDRKKGSYPVSKYQQLRYALEDGDMIRAKAEYDALAKTMKPSKIDSGFRQSMRHPFTDSAAHDVQFAASLKGYDRQLYDQALRTRQQILNAFSALPNYR